MPRKRSFIQSSCCCLAILASGAAQALDLNQCDRVTVAVHGGEDMHRDLGEGRVIWRNWWSNEGTASDFMIVDCMEGRGLSFRTAEERMTDRGPFDRTDAALKIVELHQKGDRIFATFERMAKDLAKSARDIKIVTLTSETCACAAIYPELRGEKVPFELQS
ncbi:MAG: hypothetical protein AAF066_11945 [Pseudomonadota bacterium]